MSNEDLPDSPTDGDIDEESLTTNMPWLKVLYNCSAYEFFFCIMLFRAFKETSFSFFFWCSSCSSTYPSHFLSLNINLFRFI